MLYVWNKIGFSDSNQDCTFFYTPWSAQIWQMFSKKEPEEYKPEDRNLVTWDGSAKFYLRGPAAWMLL